MLKINSWVARAPGLETVEDWQKWAVHPTLPGSDVRTKMHTVRQRVPPNVQRKTSELSMSALEAALGLVEIETQRTNQPTYAIFASRHGEIVRTSDLLEAISRREILSPTAFSQSVHNTAVGLFTIIQKTNLKATSICAGEKTFDSALLEADAYLQKNAQGKVLVVCFDEMLPDFYQLDISEKPVSYVVAFLLTYESENSAQMCSTNLEDFTRWPRALGFMADFLKGRSDGAIYSSADQRWVPCAAKD